MEKDIYKNLSIPELEKQYNEILTSLDNNNTNRIRYWFNGRIVLIKTRTW